MLCVLKMCIANLGVFSEMARRKTWIFIELNVNVLFHPLNLRKSNAFYSALKVK